jgi:hypothetical protein
MKRLSPRQSLRAVSALALAAGLVSAARDATQSSFTVAIRNVATDKTLKLPDGSTM